MSIITELAKAIAVLWLAITVTDALVFALVRVLL